MKSSPLNILILFCVSGLFLPGCSSSEGEPAPLPNVIYILADDLGYGDIGAFNSDGKILTPHLNTLAQEGMIFTDAHSTSAVCTPTRYGIITGRYSWRSSLKKGVLTGISPPLIPRERTTVASLLKGKGYQTAAIGKWHLGWDWSLQNGTDSLGSGWQHEDFVALDFSGPVTNGPTTLGFDYFYGHAGSLDMAPYVYVENGQVTALPDSITVDTSEYGWWRKGYTGADFDHHDVTPNFFRRATEYVKEASDKSDPYFLYLALPSPHTPILPTGDWKDTSQINPYADFMMQIDHYVGELIQAVNESGEADNTMIIFTSDNGPSPQANFEVLAAAGHSSVGPYRGHKADLYEGGHRVPFIVKWPKTVASGSKSDQLLSTTDLMATLAEIIGDSLSSAEGEDSFSFLPILQGQDTLIRSSMVHHSVAGQFAIREGEWKLLLSPGSGGWSAPSIFLDSVKLARLPPLQLYQLSNDPREKENLSDQYPERVAQLRKKLRDLIQSGRSTPGPSLANDPYPGDWPEASF